MKKYKKQICLIAAVCLLGAAAFCGYHIYDHYAHEAEQTEAFENIAAIVEQAQTEDNDAPEVPLTEEENVLAEYGELFLKNTDTHHTQVWQRALSFRISRKEKSHFPK